MNATTLPEFVVDGEVKELLKRHAAEAEFQQVSEVVRSCFPEMRAIKFRIQEDPDEEDRAWIIFHITMPKDYPFDRLREQKLKYHERLVKEVPRSDRPSFAIHIDFLPG